MSDIFELLQSEARMPTRATLYSAGFDFFPLKDYSIKAGEKLSVPTGIKFKEIFPGFGVIADRSSVYKKGLHLFRGTVDGDYQGEIKFVFENTTTQEIDLPANRAMGQMIIFSIDKRALKEKPGDKERGKGGFGSTVRG